MAIAGETAGTAAQSPGALEKLVARLAGTGRRIGAWLRDLPARSALRICNHGVVRPLLGRRHRRALADNRAHLPFLARKDSEIVAGLERDGVFVTTLGALGLTGSDEITRIAAALGGAFAPEAHARLSKGQAFLYVPPETVAAHPLLFSWGLQDRLLDIAEAYIGLPAAYDGVCINYTVADGREVSTRRWHRDWEDRKMLKVAIYLHDVDGNNGPFELISRKDSTQSDADGFVYGLADNEDLERRFGANFAKDVISCEGPAGTVIFVDTARFFHRGKPATHGDRIALFYSYFSHRPRHPFLCERTGMPRREIARLSASLSPRQRSAALWRRKLPTILRLVPPARL